MIGYVKDSLITHRTECRVNESVIRFSTRRDFSETITICIYSLFSFRLFCRIVHTKCPLNMLVLESIYAHVECLYQPESRDKPVDDDGDKELAAPNNESNGSSA